MFKGGTGYKMKNILYRAFLFFILIFGLFGCAKSNVIDYNSVGSIFNNSKYGNESGNSASFSTVSSEVVSVIEYISANTSNSSKQPEYSLIVDKEYDVIALSLKYNFITLDEYRTNDVNAHSEVEASLKHMSSVWYQGVTDFYNVQENRYKLCAVTDMNGKILAIALNEEIIYDAWENKSDDEMIQVIS